MKYGLFDTSAHTLKILAAAVWYGGGFVLLIKSRALLAEAFILRPDSAGSWGIIVAGVVCGCLKARY
ncbi:hypothetical protein ACFL2E_13400, partial [Thermodesulfobacteriota bacterium]